MTSVLNVDTIADKAGTGPVGLTKQEASKAYSAFDMTDDSTVDSFNIASLTDRASGSLYGNYTNAFSSVSHVVVGSCSVVAEGSMGTDNANRVVIVSSDTASRYSENCFRTDTQAKVDEDYIAAVSMGDLA